MDAKSLSSGSDALQKSAWIALAIAAPIYAATTWQLDYAPLAARNYAIAIVTVEYIVVALAMVSGFRPGSAINRLTLLTRWSMFAWISVVVMAAVTAELTGVATVHAAVTVIHAVFALALWERFSNGWRNRRRTFLTAVAAGAAGYAILVTILALSVLDHPEFRWREFGAGVSNVRQIGFYGIALAGISLGLLATESDRHWRWLQWAMLITGYYLVNLSGGRAAFGATIGASLIVLVLAPREARRRMALLAFAAFLLAILISLSFTPARWWGIESIFGRTVGRYNPQQPAVFFSGRVEIWSQTAEAILERPLIGHGEGQFRYQVPPALGMFNHPHNALLQFLYQWGIIGTVALGAALVGFLRTVVARIRAEPEIGLPACGVLAGMALMSLFEGNFYHAYPIMVSLVCLAAIAASRDPKGAK